LLIIQESSVENDGIIKKGVDLFFYFLFDKHLVSIGNLPSDADVLDNLVFIFFGLSMRVVFRWNFERQCDMFIIIIFNIENK
jgi:hypothetical protein